MIKIGLTGNIGSGKSLVSKLLKEHGYKIIDADKIVKNIYETHPEVNIKIMNCFGSEFFYGENILIKKKLGKYVFKSVERRKQLESIIIPYVKQDINKFFKVYENEKFCILDAPTLIENNMHLEMDYNVLIYSNVEDIKKRLIMRDGLDEEEILNRLNAQMPFEEKKKFVDYIIINDGSKGDLINEVNKFVKKLNMCFSEEGDCNKK